MISPGQRFAYRERARELLDPLWPAEIVKEGPKKSQKVRVRWLGGEYEGLEEWVPKVRLVAPWDEAEALLEDERKLLAAAEVSRPAHKTVPWRAVQKIFHALPSPKNREEEVYFGISAIEEEMLVLENLDAAATAAGLDRDDLLEESLSFIDRHGTYKAPFVTLQRVAQHLCRRSGHLILRRMKAEEEALQRAIVSGVYTRPDGEGNSFSIRREKAEEWLAEESPVIALVREWCGEEAVEELDRALALEAEVDRLTKLLDEAVDWFRLHGHPVKASLLLKEVAGRE